MGFLITLLAILGLGMQLNRSVKWPIELSILFASSSLICILYFSGLLGVMQIVAFISIGIGILLFSTGIFSLYRSGNISKILTPGLIFFLISVIGLWIITSSEYYSTLLFVDDFAHWGRASQIIANNNRFLIPSDQVMVLNYPPGMALFNYLFFLFSDYSDSGAMFAQGVFVFAAFSQIFSFVPKNLNKYAFIGISLFIYTFIYFFGLGLHTLSVDLIMGVVFGAALVGYLVDRKNNLSASIIRLIPLVILLILIKQIGIFFSLIVISVVVSDVFVSATSKKERIKLFSSSMVLLIVCVLTYYSWSIHAKNQGDEISRVSNISIDKIAMALSPNTATTLQKTIIDNFTRRIFLPDPAAKITRNYYWFALCLAFVWLIWFIGNDYKSWKKFVPFIVLFGGFCAYLMILLVLYLFTFGDYEGPRLASLSRYAYPYLAGVLIVAFGISLSQYFKNERGKKERYVLILLCFLVVAPHIKAQIRDIYSVIKGEQNSDVYKVSKYWGIIKNKTSSKSNIYLIWQGSNGTESNILNHGIFPRSNNRSCASIGKPYNEKYDDNNDIWTCQISPIKFAQILIGYDYLLLANIDNNFKGTYSSLFGDGEMENGMLYQILKENGGIVLQNISVASPK